MINGILNVYKDRGYTSHDVVARLRGILKQKKIGHTGTLDPDATGVLPVCLGSGTKLCDMITDKSKEYEAVMLLGITTDTEDASGKTLSEAEYPLDEELVKKITMSFIGEYDQIPPMYSAIKINGKKLYELAREGKTIERKPRQVVINDIKITEINLPRVKFTVSCSKGTYIRSLCRDIGEKIGCGACMESLVRTRVGVFEIEESLTLQKIEALVSQNAISDAVTPVDKVFSEYPAVTVYERNRKLVENGNMFPGDRDKCSNFECVRVYLDEGHTFAGIYRYDSERGFFMPVKMFL